MKNNFLLPAFLSLLLIVYGFYQESDKKKSLSKISTNDDVAYIGDDLPDIDILKNVRFSACPNDAVEKVKKICNYICTKNGGYGAVREFVEKVLEINKNINICFCIPARFNSSRLKNKLLLKFDDQTCIQKTLSNVLKSKYFNNNIYIFTGSEKIRDDLLEYNCRVIMTSPDYADRISLANYGYFCKLS